MAATTATSAPASGADTKTERSKRRLFWSICFGHMAVDGFNSIGPVIMAFMAAHVMPMTNTQIGFAISLYQLFGAITQPFFGFQADRSGGKWLGAGGVAWVVILEVLAIVIAALTGSYILMLIPFVLAALGSGSFHPVGSMHAAESSKTRSMTNLSIFFLMGQTGSAIAPTILGILLDSAATHNNVFTAALGPSMAGVLRESGSITPIFLMALIALPPILWLFMTMPSSRAYNSVRVAAGINPKSSTFYRAPRAQMIALGTLAVVVALRSFANPGVVAFIPRLFALKGWSAAEYGLITGGFWLAGGLAGVLFSRLAEQFGARRIISITLILAAPLLYILPGTDGIVAFVVAWSMGALSGGSHSLIVALSQRLIPAGKGFSSGASLGYIFGMGALGTLLIGAIADRTSIGTAYQVVSFALLATGLVALLLPPDDRAARARLAQAAAAQASAAD